MTVSLSATHTNLASHALREVAASDPERVAIEVDDERLTYADFSARADRLAQHLVRTITVEHAPVALRCHGTIALAVGFLAIQRAAMVSVPIDPTAPHERVRTILADVEPALILSDVDGDDGAAFGLPTGHPLELGAGEAPEPIDRERGELISIVYTSGSTGVPKGIMLGPASHVQADAQAISAGSRIGGLTAGTVSFIELLVNNVLYQHGTLVAYEIRRHGLQPLGAWIADSRIVAFPIVPTVLRYLLPTLEAEQRFPDLRLVVLTGESSSWDDVTRLRAHLDDDAIVRNSFGLTETGGIASFEVLAETPVGQGPLPTGTIEAGVTVEIRDPAGKPVAPGEAGEIVVQSPSLALGYWRRPDLTAATFREREDGGREVLTGDGGRIRADGTLEHLGRLDHLIKVSGNRVELGEVENAMRCLDGVAIAAAAPYVDATGNTRLAACLVPAGDAPLDARVIRASLSRTLAGYMVPDRIAIVATIPQLPGGKVDRGAIASLPAAESAPAVGEQGWSELERALAAIWRDVLEVEQIERDDDFFAIGGDSIRAARVFVELERRHGIDRPISLLAETPTLASLALMLTAEDTSWDALLAVRAAGSRPPLFVVHDGAGNVLNALGLADELDGEQPIYGIRCQSLDGTPPSARSIEELAGEYVAKIRKLYPIGPYVFYGVSLGGMIALEMARSLLLAGEDVPLVVLGDSVAFWERSALAHGLQNVRDRVGRIIHHSDEEIRQARDEARRLAAARRQPGPIPVDLRTAFVLEEYGKLARTYVARAPFPKRVLLLRAGGERGMPDRGWGGVLGAALDVADVPGTHADLARDRSAGYVGPALAEALDRL